MLIELEEPYKSLWDKGYLTSGSDNRLRVHFVRDDGTRFGTSYARYLMSVKHGYVIPDDLHVDHKDDDKTNDCISNLQLLTPEQNALKEARRRAILKLDEEVYGYSCAQCDTRFMIDRAEYNKRIASTKTGLAFCCHICSDNYAIENGLGAIKPKDDETIAKIVSLRSQGKSSYKIAEELGIARNTVMKYWNG